MFSGHTFLIMVKIFGALVCFILGIGCIHHSLMVYFGKTEKCDDWEYKGKFFTGDMIYIIYGIICFFFGLALIPGLFNF